MRQEMLSRTGRAASRFGELRLRSWRRDLSVPAETAAQPGFSLPRPLQAAMDAYEEFIGIKAVKDAQEQVMQCEKTLSTAQLDRRGQQTQLRAVQNRLKEIHGELDRTSRGEDRYLHLLTEEHAEIKRERALLAEFEQVEQAEREAFHRLSTVVRWSHEKERERAEKTKYWSISASLFGALLGIIGATISNELRMRRLRELVPTSAQLTPLLKEFTDLVVDEHRKVASFISDMKSALRLEKLDAPQAAEAAALAADEQARVEQVVAAVQRENARLFASLDELKRLVQIDAALAADPNNVAYVGPQMKSLLEETERSLESKMKLQTLLAAVFIYSAVGITIPLVWAYFRD